MGFFKLFQKKQKSEPAEDPQAIVFDTQGINFHDEEQRSRYVMGCLEQIAEAERETEKLTGEYALVTDYLSDMEEIEALPEQEMQILVQNAKVIHSLENDRRKYLSKKNKMTEAEYQTLRSQEDNVAEGIAKLKEAEKYAGLIKQDLRKLDVERQAHTLRKQELETMCANYKGMALVFMAALLICLVILAFLQFVLDMETYSIHYIVLAFGAIAITAMSVKYMDAQKELSKIQRAISKLIQLQNKVKIRYVNNTNLLDYYHLKYNTDSADKLSRLWAMYQKEKEERKQFAEAEAKIDFYREQLVSQLTRCRLKDPRRWLKQTAAILDKREMVEIRHELILRRQALRKQLEYNNTVAENAHNEVLEISNKYPAYRSEILGMVDKYQQESERLS